MPSGADPLEPNDAMWREPAARPAGSMGIFRAGRDRVLDWRNRLLTSLQFHRFVAKVPFLRGIGNRRSRELLDLATGFVHTQILVACLETGLLDALGRGPMALPGIARATRLSPERALRLVRAAVALRLLEWRDADGGPGRRVGLGTLGAALLGAPGVRRMMIHNQILYRDLADPVSLLRGEAGPTDLSQFWPYAAPDGGLVDDRPATSEHYSRLMAESQVFVADDVAAVTKMSRYRKLVDIGGGDGTFLRAIAAQAPALELVLFDLPSVADIARQRFAAAALPNKVTTVGGSFRTDPIPEGADAISLIRVAHDHDDPVVEALFARIHAALAPGGQLIVAEPMAGTSGAESFADAYFGFYFLAMGTGRARSPAELTAMLMRAGFSSVSPPRGRRPIVASVLIAHKAG